MFYGAVRTMGRNALRREAPSAPRGAWRRAGLIHTGIPGFAAAQSETQGMTRAVLGRENLRALW